MTPERWQQIDKLLEEALELHASERGPFLDRNCAGDEPLRRKLDALLSAHKQAESFIEKPALEGAAQVLAEQARSIVGRQLGHYQILELLGAGGMGQVFLAHDTRLNRRVALKLLSTGLTTDEERRRRFRQEALSASALNHPNILTIYEIQDENDQPFMAAEFVAGVTLRARMRGRKLSPAEALDIALQIGGALAAAHNSGIVHRDIKPENVMIRPDGLVKVLDFGIAKYTRPAGINDLKGSWIKTATGVLIGTTAYMSPEQARGQPVDGRTDIWSLGVILYEMLVRRLPFVGATPTDRVAAILEHDPPSLSKLRRGIPAELERIVCRALAKNKEERYQRVGDLLEDLRNAREALGDKPRRNFSLPVPGQVLDALSRRRAVIALGAITLVALAITFATVLYLRSRASMNAQPAKTLAAIDSLAVLPFANVSGNADTEYLSDGITESIISNLSQLSQLRVIARSTAFRYKAEDIDPQRVGEALKVRAVLTGRVTQMGENLSISTELVNVSDGTRLWGGQYNRKFTDVLAMQEEMAKEISEKLRLRLTGPDEKQLTKRYTDDTEAYRLYLLGRFHWNKFTEKDIKKSIEYYNQALAKDPKYALAYFGLSDAYQLLGQIGLRPNEVLPKALVYAEKTLAADPTLPEAHLTRGAYELWYGWNWTVAEQELKRALETNPNLAGAHDLYGQFLSGMGHFDEAIAENKRAVELDPLSPISTSNLGVVYYYAGRYDLAIEQNRKAMELDANFFFAPLYIGWAYGQQGKYPEAIAELTNARDLPGGFAPAASELGYIYAISARRTEAQKLLRELRVRAKREFIDPYYLAIIYVGLGKQDEALTWLNKAYEERSFWLLWLKVEPKFDPLRSDPRYEDLLRRMHFPS